MFEGSSLPNTDEIDALIYGEDYKIGLDVDLDDSPAHASSLDRKEKKKKKKSSIQIQPALQPYAIPRRSSTITRMDIEDSLQQEEEQQDKSLVSMIFLYTAICIVDQCSFLACLPSLLTDHSSPVYWFSWIIMVYNTGQLFLAPVCNNWTKSRELQEVIIICSLFGSVSSFFMSFIDPSYHIGMLFLRLLAGFSGSGVFSCYSYISRHHESKLSILGLSTYVCLCCGLGLFAILSSIFNAFSVTFESYEFNAHFFIIFFHFGILFLWVLSDMLKPKQLDLLRSQRIKDNNKNDKGKGSTWVVLFVRSCGLYITWLFLCQIIVVFWSVYHHSQTFLYFYLTLFTLCVTLSYRLLSFINTRKYDMKKSISASIVIACGFLLSIENGRGVQAEEWQLYIGGASVACFFSAITYFSTGSFSQFTGLYFETLSEGKNNIFAFWITGAATCVAPLFCYYAFTNVDDVGLLGNIIISALFAALDIHILFFKSGSKKEIKKKPTVMDEKEIDPLEELLLGY